MTKGNREAEKKRLVEALIGFPLTDSIKVTGTDCVLISRRDAEDLADKLIDANGVIVPPCKVGTEYFFPTWSDEVMSDVVKEISFDGSTFVFSGKIAKFIEYDIGKRVFLTTEEAEKALKEAQNG